MTRFDTETTDYLIACIREIITVERWAKFEEVLASRTNHIAVVLEDIYQPHNASAVIRTCELLGINHLHIIENQNPYEINPDIVVGSDKWIKINKHNSADNNTLKCYRKLRNKGYRIVATSPHKNDCLIEELPLDQKTALVFGNEGFGLSETALAQADAYVKIPSYGFTESYNISVAVALSLYQLTSRLKKSHPNWQLPHDEKQQLLLEYALKSVRQPQILVKRLLANRQTQV
jgi:tRNA (guanosine-2'-O-)-methyltransferase